MKTHVITLPVPLAGWWKETAEDLGLEAHCVKIINGKEIQVIVQGKDQQELKASWNLFVEKVKATLRIT